MNYKKLPCGDSMWKPGPLLSHGEHQSSGLTLNNTHAIWSVLFIEAGVCQSTGDLKFCAQYMSSGLAHQCVVYKGQLLRVVIKE